MSKNPQGLPVGADICSLADIVIVVGQRGIDLIPPGICSAGPRPAGILAEGESEALKFLREVDGELLDFTISRSVHDLPHNAMNHHDTFEGVGKQDRVRDGGIGFIIESGGGAESTINIKGKK